MPGPRTAPALAGILFRPVLPGQGFHPDGTVRSDVRHIQVDVSGHTAKLYGHVHSMREANAAKAAATAAPGIADVESHLVVTP